MIANLTRNVWAFNIIFCGHFPSGRRRSPRRSARTARTVEESRGHWYDRQMLGSANMSGSPLFHILSGNLSHQIEHHLFPDMPAQRYAEIAVEIREICERYGLQYSRPATSSWRGGQEICRLALPGRRTPEPAPVADVTPMAA